MGSAKKQSFLSGAMILTATIAVTKVIGALYKIPWGICWTARAWPISTPPITSTGCC